MSYGPFLGGKRICLGKTFAENIGKCVTALLVAQMDLEFVSEEVKRDKPNNTIFHSVPVYEMRVSTPKEF